MKDHFQTAKMAKYIIDNIKANKEMVFARTVEIVGVGDVPNTVINYGDGIFIVQELVSVTNDDLRYNTYKIKNQTLIRHMIMYSLNGRLLTLEGMIPGSGKGKEISTNDSSAKTI